jgi:hypothetical protein
MSVCAMVAGAIVATSSAPLPPPLTDAQQVRLAQANDGGDHQEEAFLALAEHVRSWAAPNAQSLVSVSATGFADIATLMRQPAAHRGEFAVVRGAIQQQSPLGPGFDDVHEWFVRDADGKAVIVYVIPPPANGSTWRDGQSIEVPARFYKIVQAVARDGSVQQYPAFVGAFPRAAVRASGSQAVESLWLLAVPVGALIVVYFALSRWARSANRNRQAMPARARRFSPPPEIPLDADGALPDDPAAALAELKRRAAENRE